MMKEMEASEFVCTWKIENFNFCRDTEVKSFESPSFVLPYGEKPWKDQKFFLKLFRKGQSFQDDELLECALQNCNGLDKLDRALVEEPLLDFNLSVLLGRGEYRVFVEGRILKGFKVGAGIGIIPISKELFDTLLFLPEDTLTIKCNFLNGRDHFASMEISVYTELVIKRHTFTWEIENFDFASVKKEVYIPSLSSTILIDESFNISIQYEPHNGNVKFDLYFKISWKPVSGGQIRLGNGSINPCKYDSMVGTLFQSQAHAALNHTLEQQSHLFALKDRLTLFVEFEIWEGEESNRHTMQPSGQTESISGEHDAELRRGSECQVERPNERIPTMIEDMKKLYAEQRFCDFSLVVDGNTFPVHKNILSARSPVFCAMFGSDWKEKDSGEVDVEDVDSDTMGRFLKFVYFQHFQDLTCQRATRLYAAADKYQLMSLKFKCIDYLLSTLAMDNVCDILTLADRHHDSHLIVVTKNFVYQNAKAMLRSAEWKRFKSANPQLASDIMEEVCLQNL